MRSLSPLRIFAVLTWREFLAGFRGPLFWIAVACLLALPLPVRMAYGGDIVIMGRPVSDTSRLAVALGGGYSLLLFFATLYALCLCLERTGSHYLRSNDLLILARSVGRLPFYAAKLTGVYLNALLYGLIGFFWLWEELAHIGASESWRLLVLLFSMGLTLACLIAVYFTLRNLFGNFLIFFVWLLALPVLFLAGLWHAYLEPLQTGMRVFLWLPQFGVLHAWALNAVHPTVVVPIASVLNVIVWTAASLVSGVAVFLRKRL